MGFMARLMALRELDPEAIYLTQRYETALRNEVLRLAREDPQLVRRNVVRKVRTLASAISSR